MQCSEAHRGANSKKVGLSVHQWEVRRVGDVGNSFGAILARSHTHRGRAARNVDGKPEHKAICLLAQTAMQTQPGAELQACSTQHSAHALRSGGRVQSIREKWAQ